MRSFLSLLALAVIPLLGVEGFSFTTGTPTQCDDINIQWKGGIPPFQVLLIPRFGTPRNISVPASVFNDGTGAFSVPLPFDQNSKFLVTMSDSTGFGSGGSTEVLITGPSQGGSCNTTDPGVDFSYELNDALEQCSPYVFSGYDGATQPVTIMGIIPGGESFVLNPPINSASYTWVADVWNGTSLIFVMIDSAMRQGGSSDIYTVLASGDSSCIDASSPSSTISPTHSTSAPSTATSPASSTSSSGGSTPIGAIAGTVLGALIFLSVTITLGLFFLRKYRDKKPAWGPQNFRRNSQRIHPNLEIGSSSGPQNGPYNPYHSASAPSSGVDPQFSPFNDLDAHSQHRTPLGQPGSNYSYSYSLSPYTQSEAGQSHSLLSFDARTAPLPPSTLYPPSATHHNVDPFSPSENVTDTDPFTTVSSQSSTSAAAQRKAAMSGATSYKPSRFILHTDIEDAVPPDNGEEFVELPPQYTERRRNFAGTSISDSQHPSRDPFFSPS